MLHWSQCHYLVKWKESRLKKTALCHHNDRTIGNPSELWDQLHPLCMVRAKRSFLCDSLFALSLFISILHGWPLQLYTRHTPSGEVMCYLKLPKHYSLLDSKTRQSRQKMEEISYSYPFLCLFLPHLSTRRQWDKLDKVLKGRKCNQLKLYIYMLWLSILQ